MALSTCGICGEKSGGRLRYRPSHNDYVHVGRCVPADKPMNGNHAHWPIVTTHLSGPNDGPMVIGNLRQLRQAEKDHGCSSAVFSYDQSNQ